MITAFTQKTKKGKDFFPEFVFTQIHTTTEIRFHVSVVDQCGRPCHFTMAKSDGRWKIVNAPQPPDWIINIETELHEMICRRIPC